MAGKLTVLAIKALTGPGRYMDGGGRSSDNADLAEGAARIVVVSPFGLNSRLPSPLPLSGVDVPPSGVGHGPQESALPHPSLALPQVTPSDAHVAGVQPQTFGVCIEGGPPPHVCGATHVPHE